MEYRILGSLEAWSDGRAVALGPPKQRTVLAILLLHAGEVVPTDRLIELAWGERAPRTAAHSLQIYVSELRKGLERGAEAPVIVTRPPGYSLLADPDLIDARRFERLIAQGKRDLEAADPAAAEAAVGEALGLWRGPPLSDFAYEEFAQDQIRRLETLHVDALELSAAAELALGREQAALTAVESAIAEDPLRERSRDLQMRALYRSGRHPAALRAYEAFRTLLREELGVEPSPALQRLQEQILLHDPALGPTDGRDLAATATPVRNPYKGLRPFGEEDAGDFFGRDILVAQLLEAIARGTRLLALVGPSGCGKSSVLHAGLLPAIRSATTPGSDRWAIARMMPGPQPLEALDAALGRVGWPAGSEWWRSRERDGTAGPAPELPAASRLLLVVDQLEELFSIGDEPETTRFVRDLTAAVTDPDGPVTVVLALRADFYDRPLLHAGFAPVFTAGVVNVMPMTAEDLEAAVVGPARRVGLDVDPALLARLTADTADRPAALPLLQYTLTELFERRTSAFLSLEDYRALGGLHDALSRRAEEIWAGLAEDRRAVALQVFLRLVRLGDGAGLSRRRVPLRELTSLELDPVALSEVLEVFGRHRFLAFDRDRDTTDAIVEVAHEALLSEWGRLAGWIEGYRVDLRQHESLAAAAGEWEASGRDPDYLLIGSRLEGYAAWGRDAPISLTAQERDFLDLSVARRRSEQAEEARSRERQRRLERRAKLRLWGLLAAVAALAAVATFGVLSWLGSQPPATALLVEGTGDAGFGDMAVAGVERARDDFGLTYLVETAKGGSREVEAKLRGLSERGVKLVVVGIGPGAGPDTAAVAADHPATRYVVWENDRCPTNATNVTFRSEEAAYLAGAAAALKSPAGIIGFIGAFKHPIFDAYLAGYAAGARSVDPAIQVRTVYLADYDDASTVSSPELGARAARQLYGSGADVVFAVAGRASWGAFMVADSASKEQGRQLWAIGVDTDEYRSALPPTVTVPAGEDANEWRQHILTSVTKRLDLAFHTVLGEYTRGVLATGPRSFGLAEGDVDISYSGGFIDDIRGHLEALRAGIVSGEIKVPAVPVESAAATRDVAP